MELFQHFKSLTDQDTAAVVICDTDHNMICMNPAALFHKPTIRFALEFAWGI